MVVGNGFFNAKPLSGIALCQLCTMPIVPSVPTVQSTMPIVHLFYGIAL
jgi:hypothetical protein